MAKKTEEVQTEIPFVVEPEVTQEASEVTSEVTPEVTPEVEPEAYNPLSYVDDQPVIDPAYLAQVPEGYVVDVVNGCIRVQGE
jgi:hypothetical protein